MSTARIEISARAVAREFKLEVERGLDGMAVFHRRDASRPWRYFLTRTWDLISTPKIAAFIMCNPSTADAFVLDPTIRRCVGFAKREGCTGLVVVNVYALRSTQPDALHTASDPIGWFNSSFLELAIAECDLRIAAWGAFVARNHPWARAVPIDIARKKHVQLLALKRTKNGDPGHPLYVPASAPLVPLERPGIYFTTEAV